jgi:hypothetical protein
MGGESIFIEPALRSGSAKNAMSWFGRNSVLLCLLTVLLCSHRDTTPAAEILFAQRL